jgi:hypothetical protein
VYATGLALLSVQQFHLDWDSRWIEFHNHKREHKGIVIEEQPYTLTDILHFELQ